MLILVWFVIASGGVPGVACVVVGVAGSVCVFDRDWEIQASSPEIGFLFLLGSVFSCGIGGVVFGVELRESVFGKAPPLRALIRMVLKTFSSQRSQYMGIQPAQ